MRNVWLVLSLFAVACAVDQTDDGSDDDGLPYDDTKADGLGAAPAAWHWANETRAEFEARGPQHLTFDNAMVKRLQFWIDTADTALRAKYPTRLENIPKPQLFIDTSDADQFLFGPTNALTRQQLVCLPEAAKLAKPGYRDFDRLAFYNNGVVAPASDCLERPDYAKEHAAIVVAFNKGSKECKITDGTSAITFGANCIYSVEFTGGPKSGKTSAFTAMSSYIAFEPGLIKTFSDEDALLFALFHELGHYYNAHLSVATDFYNYFYSLDQHAPGSTPTVDSHYASLTSSVRKAMQSNAVQKFQYHFGDEDTRVEAEHLGFYTVEQEADNFSIEVMTLVNVDPTIAVKSLLDLAASWEKTNGVDAGSLSAAQCSALAAKAWKDSTGNPAHVPLGTIANLHHSPCFRAWNIGREITARGYKVDSSKHPTPPGASWSSLLQQI